MRKMMLLGSIFDMKFLLEGKFTNESCELTIHPIDLLKQKERKIKKKDDSRIHKRISTSIESEYSTQKIECLRSNTKEEESESYGDKHNKMKCIESLTTSNIYGNNQNNNSRNDEEYFKKRHERKILYRI
jgi:hypothetical protein